MVSKKNGLVITVLGILSLFVSVIYISSCTRTPGEFPYSCSGVVCQNGGRCDSGKCVCPVGFEGTNCATGTVDKFIGYWKVTQIVLGSDSLSLVNTQTNYTLRMMPTATNTTFFLYNFNNNPAYSSLICRLDSNNKADFGIDTTSATNMIYDQFRIRNGYGFMYTNDSISMKVFVRRLNSTVNWQNDTLALGLKRL